MPSATARPDGHARVEVLYGSWKMICIRRRRRRSAARSSAKRSVPSNDRAARWSAPAAAGSCAPPTTCRSPLSPTSASVSPRPTSNETPSTARTGAAARPKRPPVVVVLDQVAHLEERRHESARPSASQQRIRCPGLDRQQLGRQLALLERLRAARAEPAARRPCGRRRHRPADRREPLHGAGDPGHRGEQALGVGVRRAGEQLRGGAPPRRSARRT